MSKARYSIGTLAITGFTAVALIATPVGLDNDFSLEIKSAFAKGKGSGNSGGKGGGKRSSKSSASKSSSGGGAEIEKARGNGHLKNHDADSGHTDGAHKNHGSLASALGNLNAAHASPNALEHASENSIVGLLAAYAEAVNSEEGVTLEEAQLELGAISNKASFDEDLDGDAVDAEVVAEVNALLGTNELKEDEGDL